MDLPALRDSDDEAGFYAAARPLVGGAWHGGALYRSVDNGQTFALTSQFANPTTTAKVLVPAGEGPTTVWDEASYLIVDVLYGDFENRTEEAVMAGANGIAVGVHGRWEIIQFRAVELLADSQAKLTGLLRGRRGTERFVGTGLADDWCVLLSDVGVVRVPMELAQRGASLEYRAIASNGNLSLANTQTFTGDAEALRPFSPVSLEVAIDWESGDQAITWIRRNRLGQEMPDGADIPMSEDAELYDVEISTLAGAVVRTVQVTTNAYTYAQADQQSDFGLEGNYRVTVYQVSGSVGRGPGISLETQTAPSVLPPITYPVQVARVTFGGAPDGNEDVVVRGSYAPIGGLAQTLEVTILGSGKTTPEEYADELFAYLDGLALGGTAVVGQDTPQSVQIESRDGDTLSLYAYAAYPYARVEFFPWVGVDPEDQWEGGTYRVPLPIQNGVKQQVSIDLYRNSGGFIVGAPDQDNDYRDGGAATLQFTIYGVDFDTTNGMAVPYGGQAISLLWAAPDQQSDLRVQALADLVANDARPKNALLAQYAEFVSWTSVGGRQLVNISMKYNYRISVDIFGAGWTPRGQHPSGFLPATQQLVAPAARYPAGAKMMAGFGFEHWADALFYSSGLGGWAAGMTIEVVVDAITASYTIDGTEATALNSTDNSTGSSFVTTRNAIFDDLETQIETGGNFVVHHELYANGQYKDWRIERTVINTAFTYSSQVTGFDLTILNEFAEA